MKEKRGRAIGGREREGEAWHKDYKTSVNSSGLRYCFPTDLGLI